MDDLDKTLRITEIFRSIQGESTWAGTPCVFVRLMGCDVRCSYCDTTYAYEGGEVMTIGAILARCQELGCAVVEITGGEPLQQENCPALARRLLDAEYAVLCETSGTLPVLGLSPGVVKVMDLKCPGSGVAEKTCWANVDVLTSRDEVKFVIGDRTDYEWSREVIGRHRLLSRCKAVLFAPVFGRLAPRDLADWIVADRLDVRLQMQLHKYIWDPQQRGV